MILPSCLIASTLFAAPILATSTVAGEEIVFCKSYDKAFAEATDRGVPILIAIIQDDEEANDDIWLNTMNSPAFVKATRHTVNVLGNRGNRDIHGIHEIEIDGKTKRYCGKFKTLACESHVQAEIGIFRDFARDGVVKTPQIMLVLPDQTVVATLIDRHPPNAFLDAFRDAEKRLPNGLDVDEAGLLTQQLGEADVWLQEGQVDRVIAMAAPFKERESEARLIQQAQELLVRVEERGKTELDGVETLITAKEYAPALETLAAIQKRYKKTMVEKVAKTRMATLSKNREVKAVLSAIKREGAATKLLATADTWLEKGQSARADKIYQRILDKYGNTSAAQQLRDRP